MRRSIARAVPTTPRASLPCPRPLVSMRPLPPSRRGYRHFAENRPQELVRKLTGLAEHPELPEVRFDMIGNLQTNKINAVLGSAELIHSVGSLHLAQAISSRAARKIEAGELAGPQRVLIEVNVSGEESKGGFSPDEIRAAAGELAELGEFAYRGL